MSNSAELGRRIVGCIAAATVVLSIATIVAANFVLGPEHLFAQLVVLGLTATLAYFLWRGSSVARWLSIGLFFVDGLGSIASGIAALSAGLWGPTLIGMGLIYATFGGILLFSSLVREYFRAAKGNAA